MERFSILEEEKKSILSRTSGFIAQAGFTHSLTPARNCTFGCVYCYVPTLGIYGGLEPEDWRRWGHRTTFKNNAAELLSRAIKGRERIYCSPLVDPYQPAESTVCLMPRILRALIARPPEVFTIQTRGTLILRDLDLLLELAGRTRLRVSFSVTTDREDVRRWYEPHCAPMPERLDVIRRLTAAGIRTFVTLAPLLPCNPAVLARQAMEATREDLIGDPLHTRAAKPFGATTRAEAERVSATRGFQEWHQPEFQRKVVDEIRALAAQSGRLFQVGPEAFRWLAQ